jgi:hypothetical protein
MKYEKTFNCIAKSAKKGSFEVVIKVWKSNGVWRNDSYIIIDGENINVSFNQYCGSKITSYAVAKKYGMKGDASLHCDCSEAKNYISRIEASLLDKRTEEEEEILLNEMIHNL